MININAENNNKVQLFPINNNISNLFSQIKGDTFLQTKLS